MVFLPFCIFHSTAAVADVCCSPCTTAYGWAPPCPPSLPTYSAQYRLYRLWKLQMNFVGTRRWTVCMCECVWVVGMGGGGTLLCFAIFIVIVTRLAKTMQWTLWSRYHIQTLDFSFTFHAHIREERTYHIHIFSSLFNTFVSFIFFLFSVSILCPLENRCSIVTNAHTAFFFSPSFSFGEWVCMFVCEWARACARHFFDESFSCGASERRNISFFFVRHIRRVYYFFSANIHTTSESGERNDVHLNFIFVCHQKGLHTNAHKKKCAILKYLFCF